MKSGIYHVKFTSSRQTYGEGFAVLKDGTVNGGDIGHTFVGTYEDASGTIHAKLRVENWNQKIASVLGALPQFELELTGTLAPDFSTFTATGGIPQHPGSSLTITGKRLADAV